MERQVLTKIQEEIVAGFGIDLKRKSPKGWYITDCPYCGTANKFGIRLNEQRANYNNEVSFNCFKGSCQEHGSEWQLLKVLGKEHLIGGKDFIKDTREELIAVGDLQDEEIDNEVVNRSVPYGWTRIEYHPYLASRGWEPWMFQHYMVGLTTKMRTLKDYLVLLINQDGRNKGYVARSTWPQEKIDAHNKRAEEINKTAAPEDRIKYHPKYTNEGGVFFERIVWGIDEVAEQTKTLIVVEGPLDKTNADKQLKINLQNHTRVLCTFGKKLSIQQINRIKQKFDKTMVSIDKKLILMYDPEAIEDSKGYAIKLEEAFTNRVRVARPPEGRDPGDMTSEQFEVTLNNTYSPLSFYTSFVGAELKRKRRSHKRFQ